MCEQSELTSERFCSIERDEILRRTTLTKRVDHVESIVNGCSDTKNRYRNAYAPTTASPLTTFSGPFRTAYTAACPTRFPCNAINCAQACAYKQQQGAVQCIYACYIVADGTNKVVACSEKRYITRLYTRPSRFHAPLAGRRSGS